MFAYHETIELQNERVEFWKNYVAKQKRAVQYWESRLSTQGSDIYVDSVIKTFLPEDLKQALGNIVITTEDAEQMRKEKLCLDAVENAYAAVNAELTAMTELQKTSKLLDRLEEEGKPAADLEEARKTVDNARAKVNEARVRAMSYEAFATSSPREGGRSCSHVAWRDRVLMNPPIRMEQVMRARARVVAAAEAAEAEAAAAAESAEAEAAAAAAAAEAKAAAEAAAAVAEAEAEEEDRQLFKYEPRVVAALKEYRSAVRVAEAKDEELRLNPVPSYEELMEAVALWDVAIAAYKKAEKLRSSWTRVSGAISRLISRGQRSRGAAARDVAARDVAPAVDAISSRTILQPEPRPANTRRGLSRVSQLLSRNRRSGGGMATRKKNRRYKKKKTKYHRRKTQHNCTI